MRRFITPVSTILIVVAVLFAPCSSVFAQSAKEKSFLALYFTDEELEVVSATRSLKSISQVAENVTVVTAAEIELLNAHTLADVLRTVTGIEVTLFAGTPGGKAQAAILGSDERQATVLIDGVVFNHPGSNIAEIGMIPVQNIEKIEIIKGPASSSWGSALGGVVNIITKQGSLTNAGGMVSASLGKRDTDDFRAEVRGKQDRLGYYLTAGRLHSDGLTPNFHVAENSAYTRLTYDITDKTDALFTLGYDKTFRGNGVFQIFDEVDQETQKIVHSTIAINSMLTRDLTLNVSFRALRRDFHDDNSLLSTGDPLPITIEAVDETGSSAKLIWKTEFQTLVIGGDADTIVDKTDLLPGSEQVLRKRAVYANDTVILGKASITPGIRYDDINKNGNVTSPSLGLTYSLANNTILRAYVAKGFTIPGLGDTFASTGNVTANPQLTVQTVQSYQAGIETAALYYVWTKVTVFRNDIKNPFFNQATSDTGTFTVVNKAKERRQGFEIELKTLPVYHTSLLAGALIVDAKNTDTGVRLANHTTRIYDLGLRYDDEKSLRALLKGRYSDLNAEPQDIPEFQSAYGSFIFDFNVIKKLYQRKDSTLEAFGTAHNIFNGDQYLFAVYKNPARWFEGGLRYTF
jgi:vitamin B12 transporter